MTDRRRHPQLGDSFDCDGDCGCSVLLCYCCFCFFISRRWLTICKEISFSISIWHWGVGFVLAKAKSDGRLTSNKTQMAKQMEIKTKIVQTPLHASLNLQSHELLSCLTPSLSLSSHHPTTLSLFLCLGISQCSPLSCNVSLNSSSNNKHPVHTYSPPSSHSHSVVLRYSEICGQSVIA